MAVKGQLSGMGSLLHLVEGLVFLLLHELPSNSPLFASHLITGTLGLQRHANASGFSFEFWQLNSRFQDEIANAFNQLTILLLCVCICVLPLQSSTLFILHVNLCSEHS